MGSMQARHSSLLLTVIDRDPKAVVRALGEDGGDGRAGRRRQACRRGAAGLRSVGRSTRARAQAGSELGRTIWIDD